MILPVYKRHEKLKKCIKSIIDTCDDVDNIELLLGYNTDDYKSFEIFKDIIISYPFTINCDQYVFNPPYHLNDKVNYLAQMASYDLIMACSNDLEFITKGWDKIIIDKFESDPSDKIFCRWINDGPGSDSLPRHYVIHKNWIKVTHNYACHLFSHYYGDNWIKYVSSKINRYEYLKDILVNHSSPYLTKDANDIDDQIKYDEQNFFMIDKAIFEGTQSIRDYEADKLMQFINGFNK